LIYNLVQIVTKAGLVPQDGTACFPIENGQMASNDEDHDLAVVLLFIHLQLFGSVPIPQQSPESFNVRQKSILLAVVEEHPVITKFPAGVNICAVPSDT